MAAGQIPINSTINQMVARIYNQLFQAIPGGHEAIGTRNSAYPVQKTASRIWFFKIFNYFCNQLKSEIMRLYGFAYFFYYFFFFTRRRSGTVCINTLN